MNRETRYLLGLILVAATSNAQCPTITAYANSPGWAKGAKITVYVLSNSNGSFSSTAQSGITNAFNGWASLPNSGQTISTQSVTSLPSNPQKPYAVVQRGTPTCGPSACTSFTAGGTGNSTDTATITVSPSTGDTGMEQLMTHEVGHSYGLKDCNGCSNTAMNPSTSSSSPTTPTSCDSAAVYSNSGGKYGAPSGGGGEIGRAHV